MEDYLIKPPKLGTFVKVMFYLLSAVTMTILVMLFFMKINDSVKASGGEIFSLNAPIEYKAYQEGEVHQVLVNEGDQVQKGDTLLIIRNETLMTEYSKNKESYFLEQINLGLNKKELENHNNKLTTLNQQKNTIYANDKHNRNNTGIEINSLEEKIKSKEEKLRLGEGRLQKDKQLFKEGVMSQQEFENKRRTYLDELNELAELRQQYKLKVSSRVGNKNTFSEKLQLLNINRINVEQEIIELKKKIFQQETLVETLGVQMEFLAKEMKKLLVISDVDGTIATLFNEKQKTRFVEKGTPLVIVRPDEEEVFLARLQIPQSAVAKIQIGQQIHLKLEAYNYYQYGILKGKIKSINPKDATNQFYLLAEIPEVPEHFELQSGYQVKGDIILQKMKLYQFVLDGLFGKLR